MLHEDAPWVVFIHGAGGSSAVWYKQLKAFSCHFNLLLIDLRGHGKSTELPDYRKNEKYTFELIANDIIQVLDHVRLPSAHFVGVSLGTLIIRQLAEIIGNRIQSMVMVGAITHFNIQSRFWVGLGSIFKHVIPFMWLYRLFAYVIMPSKNHSESRNVFIKEAKQLCQREFLRWYKLTGQLSVLFNKFEHHLPIPTLYVMGEQDYLFLEPIKKTINHVKQAALIVIEECGHVVNIEKAGIFNDRVIEFLLGVQKKDVIL